MRTHIGRLFEIMGATGFDGDVEGLVACTSVPSTTQIRLGFTTANDNAVALAA